MKFLGHCYSKIKNHLAEAHKSSLSYQHIDQDTYLFLNMHNMYRDAPFSQAMQLRMHILMQMVIKQQV